jgi:Family of unknown function (DUF6262)
MRADNSHHIIAAARQRAEQTRVRAITALRHMDTTGRTINFDTVAREADVSRSWLYTQDDLRAEIERLRDHRRPVTPSTAVPDRQRASDASLLRRLEVATARIRHLEQENALLRDALARALGDRRAADILGENNSRDTPNKTSRETHQTVLRTPSRTPRRTHYPHHNRAGQNHDQKEG